MKMTMVKALGVTLLSQRCDVVGEGAFVLKCKSCHRAPVVVSCTKIIIFC